MLYLKEAWSTTAEQQGFRARLQMQLEGRFIGYLLELIISLIREGLLSLNILLNALYETYHKNWIFRLALIFWVPVKIIAMVLQLGAEILALVGHAINRPDESFKNLDWLWGVGLGLLVAALPAGIAAIFNLEYAALALMIAGGLAPIAPIAFAIVIVVLFVAAIAFTASLTGQVVGLYNEFQKKPEAQNQPEVEKHPEVEKQRPPAPKTKIEWAIMLHNDAVRLHNSDENPKEAFTLMLQAAQLGLVQAQCIIGDFYAQGYGIVRNIEQAKVWYQQVLSSENSEESAKAAAALAELSEQESKTANQPSDLIVPHWFASIYAFDQPHWKPDAWRTQYVRERLQNKL